MERDKFDFTLSYNNYLKGGTKEVCVIVEEVLKHMKKLGNQLYALDSCVDIVEFVEAVEVLMASAFKKEDEIPETWNCDNDCKMVSNFLCPGECNIKDDATKRCPFFMDESFI